MGRTLEKTLYMATQTGGWDSDPSADGSGYTAIPAEEISEVPAGIEPIEVAYQDGRMHPKANEVGAPTLAELSFKIPLFGLGTAAGDGASPPTADWIDAIMLHILQTASTLDGEGVGSGSTATDLVLDADVFSVDDLIPYSPGTSGPTQWVYVTADAADGSYTVAPAMSPLAVDAGVAYGSRLWTPPANSLVGGDLLSFVVVDTDVGTYRYANCRISSFSIEGNIGERIMASITVQADQVVEDGTAKDSLPDPTTVPAVTPVKALSSPIAFDGTFYDAASFTLDLGLEVSPVKATSSDTGRSGHEVIRYAPSLTFAPLRTDAIRDLQRAQSTGKTLVQLGGGTLSGSVLNTLAVFFGNGQVTEVTGEDDEGHARQSVTVMAKDPGASGSPFLRVARA